MIGLLWFLCPVPKGSYAWSLAVYVAGSLKFLCLIPWVLCGQIRLVSIPGPLRFLWPGPFGSYAWFPVVPVPGSLWFLCRILYGSDAFS